MLEDTVVLCKLNVFHRGCLSVGNVRHGYRSRVRVLFCSQGQTSEGKKKRKSSLVLTESNRNLRTASTDCSIMSEQRAKKD